MKIRHKVIDDSQINVAPFFMKDMEPCGSMHSIAVAVVAEDRDPTVQEYEKAWTHVGTCERCMRNVIRASFMQMGGQLPLPISKLSKKEIARKKREGLAAKPDKGLN